MKDEYYVDAFLTYLLTEKRVSPHTFVAYKSDIGQLISFFKKRTYAVTTCSSKHLQDFLKKLRRNACKAETVARKISAIKLFFSLLHERFGLSNPAKRLITPRLSSYLPRYLSQLEITKLFEIAHQEASTTAGLRNYVMLYTLYATGLRVSELVCLTVDQCDIASGFIRVMGKRNKERMIPLPQSMVLLIKDYIVLLSLNQKQKTRSHKQFLFPSRIPSSPITRQGCWKIIQKLMKKSGLLKNVSPHSFRHSLATHLLHNGFDLRSLQMLLGHSSISTVQIYTHLNIQELRNVYDEKHPRASHDDDGDKT